MPMFICTCSMFEVMKIVSEYTRDTRLWVGGIIQTITNTSSSQTNHCILFKNLKHINCVW